MSSADGESADEEDVILPAKPALENIVFVLLGVASTLGIVVHLILLFT